MSKMGYPSSQLSIANLLPSFGSAQISDKSLKRFNTSALIETALVTIGAILAVKLFHESSTTAWLVVPGIWITAALVPAAIKRSEFAKIGFDIKQIRRTLLIVCQTSVVIFPALFCGLWLLNLFGLEFPLRPTPSSNQGLLSWLFYQFMYVAVAEEVFFRGYLQNNILRLTKTIQRKREKLQYWISIALSAAVFAVAHIIVQGQIVSVLTFLPGLIFGWLFIRSRTLLAPILFHGLANICYWIMAAVFA